MAELIHIPRAQNDLTDNLVKWGVNQHDTFIRDHLLNC